MTIGVSSQNLRACVIPGFPVRTSVDSEREVESLPCSPWLCFALVCSIYGVLLALACSHTRSSGSGSGRKSR